MCVALSRCTLPRHDRDIVAAEKSSISLGNFDKPRHAHFQTATFVACRDWPSSRHRMSRPYLVGRAPSGPVLFAELAGAVRPPFFGEQVAAVDVINELFRLAQGNEVALDEAKGLVPRRDHGQAEAGGDADLAGRGEELAGRGGVQGLQDEVAGLAVLRNCSAASASLTVSTVTASSRCPSSSLVWTARSGLKRRVKAFQWFMRSLFQPNSMRPSPLGHRTRLASTSFL